MTYEQILGRQPASTVVGDLGAAKQFVAFLSAQITAGLSTFSDSQQRYIYRLRAKWQLRAEDKDPIWNAQGSRAGRPLGSGRKKPKRATAYRDEELHDPLLASLMRKYSTPMPEDEL